MLISDSIVHAQCAAGIIANALLLYCIRRHTRISLGAYKQLLTIFASVDIFLTAVHLIVNPVILLFRTKPGSSSQQKLIIVRTTFGLVSETFEDALFPSLYGGCFSVPFTLMNVHFLYRYFAVQRMHLIPLFSNVAFIFFLASIPFSEVSIWFLLNYVGMSSVGHDGAIEVVRAEFERKHGRSIGRGGWMIMEHWREDYQYEDPWYILTLFLFDVVMSLSLTTALTLGTLTFIGIRRGITVSQNKKSIELKLLVAVTAQTLVPFIFVYIPYFCCLNFPPIDIPVELMADLCMFLTSCFPVWDAVIVIALMTDYRHALWGMVMGGKKTKASIASVTQRSTTVVKHATSLGAYKQLLSIFASVDILLTIIHVLVTPKLIIVSTTFGLVSETFENAIFPSLYGGIFSVPFTLMNVHFLYRFFAVRKPHLIPLFSNPLFILFLASIPFSEVSIWVLINYVGMSSVGHEASIEVVCAEFERKLGRSIGRGGWMIMEHWRDDYHYEDPWYILTLASFDTVMVISLTTALTLGSLTFAGIRKGITVSDNKRSIELKLLVAVTAQTLVPFIFVYIPYFCVLNFPPFAIPVGFICDLTMFLTSCFPVWDAIVILVLMTDYRNALWRMVTRRKQTVAVASVTRYSSMMPSEIMTRL